MHGYDSRVFVIYSTGTFITGCVVDMPSGVVITEDIIIDAATSGISSIFICPIDRGTYAGNYIVVFFTTTVCYYKIITLRIPRLQD